MLRISLIIGMVLAIAGTGWANNVKVENLSWDAGSVSNQDILKMTLTVSWENSWRDDFNYDAVYVFFKFKLKDAPNAEVATEQWHHLYLRDEGNALKGADAGKYDFWLSPLSVPGIHYNTGIYIFRKEKDFGNNRVELEVSWDIKNQLGPQLTSNNFANDKVLVTAHAIEMVYVPRGPFRVGDGASNKCFQKTITQIPKAYDLVSTEYYLRSSEGKPELAADHINDNTNAMTSVWTGAARDAWWIIDFGEGNKKKVTWFGVNAFKYHPTYLPEKFRLEGGDDPAGSVWDLLWEGPGAGNWNMSPDAYPISKAISIPLAKQNEYRCYRLYIESMKNGVPEVTSIGMTDVDMRAMTDYTVLIDSTATRKDSLKFLGARDGDTWTGMIPETFPNGYKGFYAMKYELSQDQYIRFLNKLTYRQQNSILNGRLDAMQEGDYVFGDPQRVSCRNGIALASKVPGRPAVFVDNLNPENEGASPDDGKDIACNYLSISDMLAYADWAGLRPLSEMEYEKMCRPVYPYLPPKGEYAWNSTTIEQASDLSTSGGTSQERPRRGNANYGNELSLLGPVRVGAFAVKGTTRDKAGAGFSGATELSGNVAEMYYNANHTDGINLVREACSGTNHTTAHGDGYLDDDGRYNGFKNASRQWVVNPDYIALRGGSFASKASELAVSDRTYHAGALKTIYERDSTVGFRLGRSVPEVPEIVSVLTLENGSTTETGNAEDMLDNNMQNYTVRGNRPEGIKDAYTYIWYMREQDGEWRVLEGENDNSFVLEGFANDTRINQYYYLRRKVFTPYADSKASSEKMVVLSRKPIVFNGVYRSWADGTYARSADEYMHPTAPYKYEGSVGSGVYRIDPDGPDGPIEPFDVYCDMETDGGGWMLVGKFSNSDDKHWIASAAIWQDTTTLGDPTNITTFADAKSKAWSCVKVNYMMFKTMRIPKKAFRTTKSIANKTLSAYFTTALKNFPNKKSSSCYESLDITFINSVYSDFPWINPDDEKDDSANGFKLKKISIAKSDVDDTMGVISGALCGGNEADFGLGISETPTFGVGSEESDVGSNGGKGAADNFNVLMFVK